MMRFAKRRDDAYVEQKSMMIRFMSTFIDVSTLLNKKKRVTSFDMLIA